MQLKQHLLSHLQYPGANDHSIDSPETTTYRWRIIREKPFLYNIYKEWYVLLSSTLPDDPAPVLEIGSGAGFLKEFVHNLITSDILQLPAVDYVIDACDVLPFADNSLGGITLINTLHHLPDCHRFFQESSRCIKPGGVLTMIEPWSTPWSSFIYSRLHHEAFDPSMKEWSFDSSGPLSGSNNALPWIIFVRDRVLFERAFPQFEIKSIDLIMPFKYLLSGGV